MRRSTHALAVILLPALSLVACAEQAEQAEQADTGEAMEMSMELDPVALRSDIESVAADWEAAVRAGDAAAVAALYSADATLLPDGAEPLSGSEAIQQFWAGFIAEIPAGATLNLETVEVHGSGNLAYEIGRFTLNAAGETIDSGKYLVVWQREPDGTWKLHVDTWNRNEAAAM